MSPIERYPAAYAWAGVAQRGSAAMVEESSFDARRSCAGETPGPPRSSVGSSGREAGAVSSVDAGLGAVDGSPASGDGAGAAGSSVARAGVARVAELLHPVRNANVSAATGTRLTIGSCFAFHASSLHRNGVNVRVWRDEVAAPPRRC